jgi:hypothetical protein
MSYLSQALSAQALSPKNATSGSMSRVFRCALEEINREYLPGTIDYVKTTDPELWERILSAEDKLTEAWLSGAAEEFHRVLDEWENLHRQAIEVYRKHGNGNHLLSLT